MTRTHTDVDERYIESPIGAWLSVIVQRVGAPEGHSVSLSNILDTGSALELKPTQYANRFDLYVVAEKPPDLENDSTPHMSLVGELEGFEFFSSSMDRWVSHLIRSSEWQLALMAFSASDQPPAFTDPGAVPEWFTAVISEAGSLPPPQGQDGAD